MQDVSHFAHAAGCGRHVQLLQDGAGAMRRQHGADPRLIMYIFAINKRQSRGQEILTTPPHLCFILLPFACFCCQLSC